MGGSRDGRGDHLVLGSVFCHEAVALMLGQQASLLLLVIGSCAGLPGGQAMQAQLRQAAQEHMQLAPYPLLHLSLTPSDPACKLGDGSGTSKIAMQLKHSNESNAVTLVTDVSICKPDGVKEHGSQELTKLPTSSS